MNERSRIKSEAIRFRKAILKSPRSKLPISLKSFPRGACGDASLLLANHLTDLGYGKFWYVYGKKNSQSHAWLEQGNLIIDITADQFGDVTEGVIVTVNRTRHNRFEIRDRHECKYNYDKDTSILLSEALSVIKENLL